MSFRENLAPDPSTGSKFDEFDFTIDEAYFTFDAKYAEGLQLLLSWKGTAVAEDGTPFEQVEKFPLGGKGEWDSPDGGKSAKHPTLSKPRANSIYGKILASIVDDTMEGSDKLIAVLEERQADPLRADIWDGLRFHMKTLEFDYGGEIGKKQRRMPVAFLGVEGAATNTPPAAAAPAASSKAIEAKLRALALKSATHSDFLNAAVLIDGVTDDDELFSRVADENGFYAEVKASA